MHVIDLRSDTVTLPSSEMRLAMFEAALGDDGRVGPDGRGEDPTVNELEAMAAEMLGKQAGLLMPSGTMANLVALMTHCSRGQEVIVGKTAHIYRSEKGGFAEDIYGLCALEVPDPGGIPDLDVLIDRLRYGRASLFCIENTHNFAGGTALGIATMQALADAAHQRGVPVHLDGARVFNAAVAFGVDVRSLVERVDTVQFCLSKGLGAPVGSLLVGSSTFVRKARERRKIIGGQMRQAGVFAAAGIVALKTGITRLHEDHEKARCLANDLIGVPGFSIDLATVQSNMVKANVEGTGLTAHLFQQGLAQLGVLVSISSSTEIRMVTHKDVRLEETVDAAGTIRRFASGK